jgi:hypothetical protein
MVFSNIFWDRVMELYLAVFKKKIQNIYLINLYSYNSDSTILKKFISKFVTFSLKGTVSRDFRPSVFYPP